MELHPRIIQIYETPNGGSPYQECLEHLDKKTQTVIDSRIVRLRQGNLGNWRQVGKGVKELKVPYGPGLRIYFGEDGDQIVVLLCGGDKGSQDRDIKKAQEYWEEYLS
jgi:putative addiction module killer protein